MISILNWLTQVPVFRRFWGFGNTILIRRMPHIRTIRAHHLGLTCAFFCSSAFLIYQHLAATPGISWQLAVLGILVFFVGSLLGLFLAGVMFLFWICCLILGTLTDFSFHFGCSLVETYVGGYLFGGILGLLYNDLVFCHAWIFRRDQIKVLFSYRLDKPIQVIKSPIPAEMPHQPGFNTPGAEEWVYNYDVPSPPGKPLTIAFVANPVFQDLERTYDKHGVVNGYGKVVHRPDPILKRPYLFLRAVENALSSLESNEVVGRPEIWSRIRVVTIFDPSYADKTLKWPDPTDKCGQSVSPTPAVSSNSGNRYCLVQSYLAGLRELDPNFGKADKGDPPPPEITFDRDVAENLLDPSECMAPAYRSMVREIIGQPAIMQPGNLAVADLLSQTDVIYGLSAVEDYDRAVAHTANWSEKAGAVPMDNRGKPFKIIKKDQTTSKTKKTQLIHQEWYECHPGRIAVNVYTADQRTYIHEFAHAISSANMAPISDEYFDRQDLPGIQPPPNAAAPPINRQKRPNAYDPIPAEFMNYDGRTYYSDREHRSARENWRGYFPEKHNTDSNCLMDRDYGDNRFDKLLSNYIYDLLMTKINRT